MAPPPFSAFLDAHAGEVRRFLVERRKAIDAARPAARLPVPVAEPDPGPAPAAPAAGGAGLWRAVRGLPPRQRAAVALRYACDLTCADVGRAMGCSEDAARRSAFEGLRRLREVWDGS